MFNLPPLDITLLNPDAKLPTYATDGSGAVDCYATSVARNPLTGYLHCGLGFALAVPPGWSFLLLPRSGRATSAGLTLANCVGLIDSDYRGEVQAVFRRDFHVCEANMEVGDRVCQGMLVPTPRIQWNVVSHLPPTQRGAGGLGSTGK